MSILLLILMFFKPVQYQSKHIEHEHEPHKIYIQDHAKQDKNIYLVKIVEYSYKNVKIEME